MQKVYFLTPERQGDFIKKDLMLTEGCFGGAIT